MKQSFKALMEGAIDYAGFFPPANLAMEEAVANYNRYLEESDSWMISHFICPTTMLTEFEKAYKGLAKIKEPYRISMLGIKLDKPDSFLQNIQEDSDAIKRFLEGKENVIVDAFEVSLPPAFALQTETFEKELVFTNIAEVFQVTSDCQVRVYCEFASGSSLQDEINSVISAIAKHNRSSLTQSSPDKPVSIAGFKLRCGGTKQEQFPSVDQVVFCVKSCIEQGVLLKLTAGLHHPFRHFNESAQTEMHGFINIFAAVLLGRRHKLDKERLTAIIEDEDPSNFQFNDETFSWKDINITVDEITEGRNNAIVSFGCCSFNEPKDDLRRFGLL